MLKHLISTTLIFFTAFFKKFLPKENAQRVNAFHALILVKKNGVTSVSIQFSVTLRLIDQMAIAPELMQEYQTVRFLTSWIMELLLANLAKRDIMLTLLLWARRMNVFLYQTIVSQGMRLIIEEESTFPFVRSAKMDSQEITSLK